MPFAEINERAEIGDKYPIRDVIINIGAHFARLPAWQADLADRSLLREFKSSRLTQQRGCLEYCAASCLFVIKLTSSCIEERNNAAHPVGRLWLTEPRIARRLANRNIHS